MPEPEILMDVRRERSMSDEDFKRGRTRKTHLIFIVSAVIVLSIGGCQKDFLQPKDLLNPPKLLDSRQEFGHIRTVTVTVPATCDIFLAEAEPGTVVEYASGGRRDEAPANSPIQVLQDIIFGGETLDVYATGEARHLPLPSINFGAKGWITPIEVGPVMGYRSFEGPIGSLVGVFDNQRQPFVIGQRKQIKVPFGAHSLYLGVLDYPGASADNQGEFLVTIDVIRR